MKVHFYLRFTTRYGQQLAVVGNCAELGQNNVENAIPLQYLNDEFWYAVVDVPSSEQPIAYHYVLLEEGQEPVQEWGDDREISPATAKQQQLIFIDTWNHAGAVENAFFTQPFQSVLLEQQPQNNTAIAGNATHIFKVKAPLLKKNEVICIVGNQPELGTWSIKEPLLLAKQGNWWTVGLTLEKDAFPIAYKYGVYNTETKQFGYFEGGNNRFVLEAGNATSKVIVHDGFVQIANNTFKGAGIAIPVFSLRTQNSWGVGEFTDMALLADWAQLVGMKLLQLLPVNDTTATHSWVDSYPYAAISAFALHPLYINPTAIAKAIGAEQDMAAFEAQRQQLNEESAVDYEGVMQLKWSVLKVLYDKSKKQLAKDKDYLSFYNENKHWLEPYAAFCYLRDVYGTVDFNQWPEYNRFNEKVIAGLLAPKSASADVIGLHCFVQYYLHVQLKAATAYAHKKGLVVKGDIPIGIYRNSCDAWQTPELYNMNKQAGAPPDDFAVKGQNWGFPTYNWQRMQADGFLWWKQRFAQMSHYFDAFRIDHILGFFRIWSIPMDAVEGILGYFVPAIPIHINEFGNNGISFEYSRYTKPYITDWILEEVFGYETGYVKSVFLDDAGFGHYKMKPEFASQRQVEAYATQHQISDHIKYGLFDLISNVLLIEDDLGNGQLFHFRISMEQTRSFRALDEHTKHRLKELYVDYFYRRQDEFWKYQALQKLPALKRTTNMLICGEDLGMVPTCVPDVMQQLGMLSLEIQRMPKDPRKEFFHPADAPYLSVVTPSTHDMSIIRGWWEEDRSATQRFYNTQLGQSGAAPQFCEPWINKIILLQHLYSPAMWSIFQYQDVMGMSGELRRENPNEERINVPANPKHYWRYRMHISLEDMLQQQAFNQELALYIKQSGRA